MSEYSLSKKTKWSYCVGATGRDMAYALVSMYLLTYVQYTMKLTVAQFGVISAAIVVCLVWDAINDPLMGIIIENTNFKMGKFKPWIIVGAVLNAAVIVLLFTVRPQGWVFVVFFSLSYLLWGMTYTMNDIAYWGMLPTLSSDAGERNTMVTLMSIFICIGQFLVAGIVPTIVAGNAVKAYRMTALVVALMFILFQTLTFCGVSESPRKDDPEKKMTLKDMFHVIGRNDQLVPIGICSLLFNIGSGLLIVFAVNFFYFEYGYKEGGSLVFLFTVMYGLGTLISQALYAQLAKHVTRKTLLRVLTACLLAGYLCLLGFGYVLPKNVILLNVLGFVIFFCQGMYTVLLIVMLNNTIEYDEYKNGERHDSVISAVRSFAAKLSGALNQGILTVTLILSGIYTISQEISSLEIESGKGIISSTEVFVQAEQIMQSVTGGQLFVLRLGMVGIPLIAFVICFVLIERKYTLDEVEYERILSELKKIK